MNKLVLIQQPHSFSVELSSYEQKEESRSVLQRISIITKCCIGSASYLVIAFGRACYNTAKYTKSSFKAYVIEDFNPFLNPVLTVMRVSIWVSCVGLSTIAETGRLWINYVSPVNRETSLKIFARPELNLQHLQTCDVALDASRVPTSIKVDDLESIFQDITFEDKNSPAYMAPSVLTDEGNRYSREDGLARLKQFIFRVKTREPFLGTPPAYDIPRLYAFYQQIEDAIRISIFTHQERLDLFHKQYGNDCSQYDEDAKKKYRNLLEDKARVAIDVSIASAHCGARYMGDSMKVYYNSIGEDLTANQGLTGTLKQLLARKRKDIAEAHIQQHLANDTHGYAGYMSAFGVLFGIPGTQNIVEHLLGPLSEKFKTLFFEEYTPEFIIANVQENVKKSQSFREAIIDWLKDQCGEWDLREKQASIQLKTSLVKGIQRVIEAGGLKVVSQEERLYQLLKYLKEKNVILPDIETAETKEPQADKDLKVDSWNKFVNNLFALEDAKNWIDKEFGLDKIAKAGFKQHCFREQIGCDVAQLKEEISRNRCFDERHIPIIDSRIEDIKRLFQDNDLVSPSEDTLKRVVSKELFSEQIVHDTYELTRRQEFIEALNLDNMAQEGLSLDMLEWILVSQGILYPRRRLTPRVHESLSSKEQLLAELILKNCYFSMIGEVNKPVIDRLKNWIESLKKCTDGDRGNIELEAQEILNTINQSDLSTYRYRSYTDNLLEYMLDRGFKIAHDDIQNASEAFLHYSLYNKCRKIVNIKIPSVIGNVAGHLLTRSVVVISTFVVSIWFSWRYYGAAYEFTNKIIIPYCIDNAPDVVLKIGRAVNYIYKNPLKSMLVLWLFRETIKKLPEIPHFSKCVENIDIEKIYNYITRLDSFLCIIIQPILTVALSGNSICSFVANELKEFSRQNELADVEKVKNFNRLVISKYIRSTAA